MSNDTRKRFDWLRYVLHAAIVVGLVIAATKYLNGGQVLAAFGRFDYLFAPFLVALAATYLALMAWRFVWLMRPVSELPWGLPFRAYLAGQPITLLPGGVAARAGLMKQAGVSVSRSAGPVALSSILDQVVFVACSLVAALFFPAARVVALVLA
ncbi:MAG TPA: lysylphosphatidylglycerol synthase domain-containing protein, partial [Trueperaceae bacterium]